MSNEKTRAQLTATLATMASNAPFTKPFNRIILVVFAYDRALKKCLEINDRQSQLAFVKILKMRLAMLEGLHSPENFLETTLAEASERVYQILVTRETIRRCEEALREPAA